MKDSERKRLRYRTQPEFRAKVLTDVARRHEANSSDPDYRRLIQLRKDIHRVRESYNARMDHAARLSERLVKLSRELVKVQAKWDKKRAKRDTR